MNVHYQVYADYLSHPVYRAIREAAMVRDGRRCRMCGGDATEVHHVKYPPWDTFDTPGNLLCVCHTCHAKIEGKET